MRPSSRQRVAAWLLALPLGRSGEECARRGRLEMISFWLLCWKLLRATAGLRRTTPELTDGNHNNSSSGNNNLVENSSSATQEIDSVTMEISSPPPPPTDLERGNLFSSHSQEVQELQYPEVHGEENDAAELESGKRDGDECDYLVFEIGEQTGKKGGSESEVGQDAERRRQGEDGGIVEDEEAEGEEVGRGESEGEVEERGLEREDEGRRNVKGEDESKGKKEKDNGEKSEMDEEHEGREKIEAEDEGSGATEGKDGGRENTEAEDDWRAQIVGEAKEDALLELLFISDSPLCPSLSEPLVVTCPSEQSAGTMMQDAWVNNLGNRDDLSDGHLSDCLQAELAIVYSDSDTGDDQWAAFTLSDVTSQGEAVGGIHDCICDGKNKEEQRAGDHEERQAEEDKIETEIEEQREEETENEHEVRRVSRDDDKEQMRSRRDLFLRSPSVSSTASSTDPDRRVPVDFCVHQETLSENVSNEHVDFLLARQQWKKLEEEVKGQPIPKPGLRAQGSFQGTHTSLYPPTRSPRLKHREIHPPFPREPPVSCTLSPSSEDSGLDDLSYRSPLEEPESAVEKEIRLTLERDERHRRERGIISQGLAIPRPSTLQTGRSPPRPPACRTPTLSISPSSSYSSSLPRSVYHEMTANNVIILEPNREPDSSNSASRNHLLSSAIGGLSDWPTSLDACF
ncbi:uncharacterized protein LOC113134103 [Mastacembelus armatus]|uniref:uncharacterized protein LOC113134103 n=1 Tax=Mastacembelus armatus TaxID=205130 RepID=UPI000E45B25B|nr:uncharacterized protein LOC113134103 [Mastacembelus armatus]